MDFDEAVYTVKLITKQSNWKAQSIVYNLLLGGWVVVAYDKSDVRNRQFNSLNDWLIIQDNKGTPRNRVNALLNEAKAILEKDIPETPSSSLETPYYHTNSNS